MKKLAALDVYVIFSILALIAYTIVSQVMAYRTGVMLDTLTTCFFGFFGGEIVTCALIKIFKLRGENKPPEQSDATDTISEEEIQNLLDGLKESGLG